MLLNYHIGRIVLGPLCVGDSVRLGLSIGRIVLGPLCVGDSVGLGLRG